MRKVMTMLLALISVVVTMLLLVFAEPRSAPKQSPEVRHGSPTTKSATVEQLRARRTTPIQSESTTQGRSYVPPKGLPTPKVSQVLSQPAADAGSGVGVDDAGSSTYPVTGQEAGGVTTKDVLVVDRAAAKTLEQITKLLSEEEDQ